MNRHRQLPLGETLKAAFAKLPLAWRGAWGAILVCAVFWSVAGWSANAVEASWPIIGRGIGQIAGLVAKRIVCFVREGQAIGVGERFGLIRFGSRLDVYLPVGTKALVSEGQTAIAGETILADLAGEDPGRAFRAN